MAVTHTTPVKPDRLIIHGRVQDTLVSARVDTGADVSAIDAQWARDHNLHVSTTFTAKVCGPDGRDLKCCGAIKCDLICGGHAFTLDACAIES